eukprot:12746700-Alexandrium_andersonii.AAC.1
MVANELVRPAVVWTYGGGGLLSGSSERAPGVLPTELGRFGLTRALSGVPRTAAGGFDTARNRSG